jgi:para-nitrobenzyl esterase
VASGAEIPAMAQTAANDASGLLNSCDCARAQAQYGTSRTYIMDFARKHPYAPGVKIADQDTATIGAYHTSEVPYFFGTLDAFNLFRRTREWTPWDRELSRRMTAALIAFAATGDPSTPETPWPAWSAEAPRYIRFGDAITVETVNLERQQFMRKHRPAPAGPSPRRAGFPVD